MYGESAESAKTKIFDPSDWELVEAARYCMYLLALAFDLLESGERSQLTEASGQI